MFHFCLLDTLKSQSRTTQTVCIIGELDQESADAFLEVTTLTGEIAVDISELTFMDSSGYQALVDARRRVEAGGGSLTLVNPAGQPKQLLALLAEIRQLDRVQDAIGCVAHPPEQEAQILP